MVALVLARVFGWARKAGFAVLDQGLFATSNFAVNLLLARWLPPTDYGAFALAYAVFALIITFHTAVLTEPMLVFGPGKHANRVPAYLGVLLWGHLAFSALASIGLLLAAYVAVQLDSPAAASAFLGLAAAAPFLLLLWLARRAFYIYRSPHQAAVGSALYLLLMMFALYALSRTSFISPGTALVTLGAASAIPATFLLWRLSPTAVPSGACPWRGVLHDHGLYGRWSTGSALLKWAPSNIFFIILPVWGGLDSAAALRAIMNLIVPITQIVNSASTLLLPLYVVTRRKNGQPAVLAVIRRTAALLSGLSLLYAIPLVLYRYDIVHFVYKAQYDVHADLVILLALAATVSAAAASFAGGLRACERPDLVFIAHAAAAGVTATVGIALAVQFGLWGVVFSKLAASIALFIALGCFLTFRFSK